MEKKPASRMGRPSKFGETKAVITAVAITLTLALWNLFSRPKEPVLSIEVLETEAIMVTEAPVAMLDLPPLPTLIPPLPEGAIDISIAQTGSGMQGVSQAVIPPSGKILLGGTRPGTPQQQQSHKKPNARTRSSQ